MLEFLLILSMIATVFGIFIAGYIVGAYQMYTNLKPKDKQKKRTRKTNETSKAKNTLG